MSSTGINMTNLNTSFCRQPNPKILFIYNAIRLTRALLRNIVRGQVTTELARSFFKCDFEIRAFQKILRPFLSSLLMQYFVHTFFKDPLNTVVGFTLVSQLSKLPSYASFFPVPRSSLSWNWPTKDFDRKVPKTSSRNLQQFLKENYRL